MKIERQYLKYSDFKDLEIGNIFEYDEEIYLRIPFAGDEYDKFNAVCLSKINESSTDNDVFVEFSDSDRVLKRNFKLVEVLGEENGRKTI